MESRDFTRLIDYVYKLFDSGLKPQNADAEQILNITHDNEMTEHLTEIAIIIAMQKLKEKYLYRQNIN